MNRWDVSDTRLPQHWYLKLITFFVVPAVPSRFNSNDLQGPWMKINNWILYAPSSLFSVIFGCVSLIAAPKAFAVWEYSLAAKLAIYDDSEQTCRHLVPELFDEVKDRLIYLDPDEKRQANQVRQSAEYFQVLQEIRRSQYYSKLPDGREKIKECTKDLETYRLHP